MGGEAPIFPFFGKKEPEEFVSKFARLFASIKKSGTFVPRRTLVFAAVGAEECGEGDMGFWDVFFRLD